MPECHHRDNSCFLEQIGSIVAARLGLLVVAGLASWLVRSEPVQSAERLEAPTRVLTEPTNRIAVMTAIDRTTDMRIDFEIVEPILGELGERVSVRVEPALNSEIDLDATYIGVISNVRRNERFEEIREIDPDGFRVVHILGGGAALFDNQASVRFMFTSELAEPSLKAADRLAATLETMQLRDERTRSLAVLELYLRPEWDPLLNDESLAVLRSVLGEPDLPADLKNYVLETARRLSPSNRPAWLAKEARSCLDSIELPFVLSTFYPRLSITAIEILEVDGRRSDGPLLARFLGANNPAVVRAALRALDKYRPDLAHDKARAVLENRDLHPESRRVLTAYVDFGTLP